MKGKIKEENKWWWKKIFIFIFTPSFELFSILLLFLQFQVPFQFQLYLSILHEHFCEIFSAFGQTLILNYSNIEGFRWTFDLDLLIRDQFSWFLPFISQSRNSEHQVKWEAKNFIWLWIKPSIIIHLHMNPWNGEENRKL